MPLSLWRLSWREWRHHPWRHGMALLAVALGVALAWSVHLINASALAEFSSAVRAANGEPDLSLRSPGGSFDDAWFDTLATTPGVAVATPLLEIDTLARGVALDEPLTLKLLGIDALSIAPIAPTLLPRPAAGAGNFAALDPDALFINARARELLRLADGDTVSLRSGPRWLRLRVAGSIAAPGPALSVMDIAGAQSHFGLEGRLTRIDVRLRSGVSSDRLLDTLALPSGVAAVAADDAEQRLSNLSRAYRVNLTVLALVALFV
ncbi:MAG: ABC transporter permease, partial [Rubrivivax sp.]